MIKSTQTFWFISIWIGHHIMYILIDLNFIFYIIFTRPETYSRFFLVSASRLSSSSLFWCLLRLSSLLRSSSCRRFCLRISSWISSAISRPPGEPLCSRSRFGKRGGDGNWRLLWGERLRSRKPPAELVGERARFDGGEYLIKKIKWISL